jgi:hypothetical protein
MANPLYILLAVFLLILVLVYVCKVSNALKFFITERAKESKANETALNEVILKLTNQLRFLKRVNRME